MRSLGFALTTPTSTEPSLQSTTTANTVKKEHALRERAHSNCDFIMLSCPTGAACNGYTTFPYSVMAADLEDVVILEVTCDA